MLRGVRGDKRITRLLAAGQLALATCPHLVEHKKDGWTSLPPMAGAAAAAAYTGGQASALSELPGASGLRARAKRLNPLPARRNHLAWRVVWRGAWQVAWRVAW